MKAASFVALALIACGACAQQPDVVPASKPDPRAAMPAAGTVAPPFTVIASDGREIRLSDYAGKIVVLDFWATWCGPCQQAMPHNDAIYKRYRDSGVVLLGICADDTRENYEGWAARNKVKYSFPSGSDPAGKDFASSFVRNAYGVTGFPTMFVVGRDGKIVGMASGGGAEENPRLLRLLAKAGAPVDLASLPPEEEKKGPASVPMVGKTPAMPAAGGMIGMGAPASAGGAPRFGTMELGQAVPDFTVVGEKGGETNLSAFKGRTVIVHFFTGTKPQPYLQDMVGKYADKGVSVLGVSTAAERKDFDDWVAAGKTGVVYPVAWDTAGKAFMESVAYMQFGVGMFPASVVIDAQGKLVDGVIGFGPSAQQKIYTALQKAGIELEASDRQSPAER